jgi:phosphatidylinositol 4-kinase
MNPMKMAEIQEEYSEQNDMSYGIENNSNHTSLAEIHVSSGSMLENEASDLDKGENQVEISKEDLDLRMRAAAIMLAQLYQQGELNSSDPAKSAQISKNISEIRSRLIHEMMELEAIRISSLEARLGDLSVRPMNLGARPKSISRPDHEDPSAAVFKEPWAVKRERIRLYSPFGKDPNWDLVSVIVKTGADLRQEQLALQLIREISYIWQCDNISAWVYNFNILIMSNQSGLVETIQDAISIHSIKKQGLESLDPNLKSYPLIDYYMTVILFLMVGIS